MSTLSSLLVLLPEESEGVARGGCELLGGPTGPYGAGWLGGGDGLGGGPLGTFVESGLFCPAVGCGCGADGSSWVEPFAGWVDCVACDGWLDCVCCPDCACCCAPNTGTVPSASTIIAAQRHTAMGLFYCRSQESGVR